MIRKFEFNTIYVIESLPASETATGTQLHDDIIRRWAMRISYLKSFLVTIDTKQAFFFELNKIMQGVRATPSLSPYLHFEIHGNKEVLVLASGEQITWAELTDVLRKINILLQNNLFLSLATCHGAYIVSQILPSRPAPFFGLIGPWKELDEGDIMQSFQTFFNFILNESDPKHIDFNKAVDILNQSTTLPRRYHFYSSELIFETLLEEHESNLWKPGGMSRRVKELMADTMNSVKRMTMSKSQLKKFTESTIIRQRRAIKDNMKSVFLMK